MTSASLCRGHRRTSAICRRTRPATRRCTVKHRRSPRADGGIEELGKPGAGSATSSRLDDTRSDASSLWGPRMASQAVVGPREARYRRLRIHPRLGAPRDRPADKIQKAGDEARFRRRWRQRRSVSSPTTPDAARVSAMSGAQPIDTPRRRRSMPGCRARGHH